ncbi:DUF3098 domain-containing protein [Fibrella aquatilis]|uniref:DUF3098 domain-containing protein n=1 Tax=Fibrella aquatilis TaxID=2817059 RepID=A0A939G522_9BACT|nr:DUF3098 domain-containing protein [Fibrella aquatilis]MBO0931190.1 DUF3098 domain-containing protein [Fibrella aquatilis]
MEATRVSPPKRGAVKPEFQTAIPTRNAPSVPTAMMPFGKVNYQLMVAGIAVLLVGFFIMSLDSEEFGFGFLGLTLGPVVVMTGFIIELFAILKKPVTTEL